MGYFYLTAAIIAEVIATCSLKSSAEFSKLWPSVLVVVGYGVSFYRLSHVLRTIPLGVTYAIWSSAGIALITVIDALSYKQSIDWPAVLGISLMVTGVVILNLFSKMTTH